ncbi:aromatase/cyclase [Kineosporia babensis]|uniref:Aromatase/cyclase n=1 Tax=Kineosporia babensis TaxID=499548 RepID=A0A9X1NL32_9ACTN|nr:aromatase/cyclase [Kineosporia babensis]MCD5315691.1 aromatase/cyclase [Kineosporia babensis]
MTTRTVRETEHSVEVQAPADQVYALVADVSSWPQIFPPTIHAESLSRRGDTEQIQIWATANGEAKTWTSERVHDPAALSVSFRQRKSQHPVGGMGGRWVVEPLSDAHCRVRLLHDFFAAGDDPADLEWISQAVERNSTSELGALKAGAEASSAGRLFTFEDTVTVQAGAEGVYDFLNDAQLWSQRLPHVARVRLEENTPGLQVLEMDTSTKDGSTHTTRSIRVCRPHRSIVYKQIVLPALMDLHTGRWLITPAGPEEVQVSSRHTVQLNRSRISEVLGPDATVESAQAMVRQALSGNSMTTLHAAKAHAQALAQAPAGS